MTVVCVDIEVGVRLVLFSTSSMGSEFHMRILRLIPIKIWSFEAVEGVQTSPCENEIHVLAC